MESKILIVRPGALGDTLMMLPALARLRKWATIHFVGRRPGLDFLRDFVHFAVDMEGPGWHRLFLEEPGGPLPIAHADSVVAFFKDEDGLIGRNLRIFFPKAFIHVFPSLPPDGKRIHVARFVAECLKIAAMPIDPDACVEAVSRGFLFDPVPRAESKTRIIFHPGSGDRKKNHSPGFWQKLLLSLARQPPFQSLTLTVLLGPAEESLFSFFKETGTSGGAEVLFCPEKPELMEHLRAAALYLGHDSGITHLAAMTGTPTVALFKSSDVFRWKPLGPRVYVIKEEEEGEALKEAIDAARTLVDPTQALQAGS